MYPKKLRNVLVITDMKIVIVDDDKLVAVSLKTIIEAGGDTEVMATGNYGEEVVMIYKKYKPDILVKDIRMK